MGESTRGLCLFFSKGVEMGSVKPEQVKALVEDVTTKISSRKGTFRIEEGDCGLVMWSFPVSDVTLSDEAVVSEVTASIQAIGEQLYKHEIEPRFPVGGPIASNMNFVLA